MPDRDEKPLGRRDFFGEALKRLLAPVAEYADNKFGAFLPAEMPRLRLRPPGALPEASFIETCHHTGRCLEVCPVQAIKLWRFENSLSFGTPYIEPDLQACVVCADIACTKACPSGALRPLARASEIRMGVADMNHEMCARSKGDECRICVEKCPVPEAIRIDSDGRVQVLSSCVGCGVCEMHCPTSPKAIVVKAI